MYSTLDALLQEQGLSPDEAPSLEAWQQFLAKLAAKQQVENNLYSALLNHRDEAVYIFDMSLRLVKANQAAAKLLAYENPDDLIGHHASEHLSPANWEDAQARIQALLNGEDVPVYERILQRPDGQKVYTLSAIKLIKDANEQALFIQSRLSDISEQKRTELALEEKERYLRTILNNLPIILWACDENAVIRLSEGSGLSKLGIEPNASVGQSILELYSHFSEVQSAVKKALNGEASDIQIRLGRREYDSRYRPIIENERVIGAVGLAIDNTELVLAQKAVQAEQAESRRVREFIETILNNSSDGIAVIDLSGRIQQNNPAFDKLFQTLPDANFNQDFLSLFIAEERIKLALTLEAAFQSDTGSRIELQAQASDKSSFYVELSLSPIIHQNQALSVIVCSIHDISNYKELQANLATARDNALETARLKSEFLAVMSHEIRTPLNAILGLLEIVHDTPLNNDQQELLAIMKEQGSVLRYLINNVLDYSKLGADKLILENLDFNLRKLLQNLTQQFQIEAQKKDLAFIISIDERIPETIHGDAHRLRQVLTIFLSNAFKFTHKGAIKLIVTRHDSRIEFRIDDTGIGIAEEAKTLLFEPFTQADSSHTRRYGGTGLGLAIAQKIVHLMGSEISIKSKVGEGSVFTFQFPMR